MTRPSEPGLVDTNVLIYASDRQAPQHEASLALLDEAAAGSLDLCVTRQILLEYVATATNPKRMKYPITAAQAWAEVGKFQSAFRVLPVPADLIDRVERQATALGLSGPDVYDVSHAQTALAAGVVYVFSYDHGVFARIGGLKAETP